MRRCLLFGDAPVAAPVASSQECPAFLWDGAFRRITPGALSLRLSVLLFLPGGQA
jgi:hypothetical protein